MDFTSQEKDAILRLGSDSDSEIIEQAVLQRLIAKGILFIRPSDGHLDLTEYGEDVYDMLRQDEDKM